MSSAKIWWDNLSTPHRLRYMVCENIFDTRLVKSIETIEKMYSRRHIPKFELEQLCCENILLRAIEIQQFGVSMDSLGYNDRSDADFIFVT